MKITNNLNLPQPFVSAVESEYVPTPQQYSVTTVLNPSRYVILSRRHNSEVEQDVADMIWMLFGTAFHSILENSRAEEEQLQEQYLKQDLGMFDKELEGYKLSGKADLLDTKTNTMIDYKTTSVYKVMFGDYEDWRKQLLMYAWLFRQQGYEVNKGQIVALMKDHSKSKAKFDRTYPQYPVKVIDFEFNDQDFVDIEKEIIDKFKELKRCEQLKDNELPMCSTEERWNDGNKYAVKKKGNKRAERVFDTKEQAEEYMKDKEGYEIEERLGEDRRCMEYCSSCIYCPYWQERYGKGVKTYQ